MLLVYTDKVTARVRYTFNLLLNELLGLQLEITSDEGAFSDHDGPKFSYSRAPLGDELFIASAGLLFKRGIEGQELSFIEHNGTTALYPTFTKTSALPFDPFSASFFLVSRYEEYLPYVMDQYDRFDASKSISFQKGILARPLVNIWTDFIAEHLRKRYPGLEFQKKSFSFRPTIDIDAAWKYKAKGLIRSAGGFLRSLAMLDMHDAFLRARVLSLAEKDPFDTYEEQIECFSSAGFRPLYFILFADYGLNDKGIGVNSPVFLRLVKSLSDSADIGIHSSFNSSYEPIRLEREITHLSGVIHRDITCSRQHYLRLNLPFMYRSLLDLGVKEDFSMGYNSHIGFRAGIADPFLFYDLDLEVVTKLRVYPFVFGINKFNPLSAAYRMQEVKQAIREVKRVNGTLVGMWDNEVLTTYHDPLWQDKIREILQTIKE